MTPKGADLEATDLIEVSTIESGSYVTRSITGQELIDAIPLPPSGLTVGTTPISSGTNGRVLFQGTGNVLQQSGNLFWDETNGRLGIGTSSPTRSIDTTGIIRVGGTFIYGDTNNQYLQLSNAQGTYLGYNSSNVTIVASSVRLLANGVEVLRAFQTGNVLIGTTTDAGFRLDVNGTARVQGAFTATGNVVLLNNGIYKFGPQAGLYATIDNGLTSNSGAGSLFLGYYSAGDTAYGGTTVTLGRLSNVSLSAASGLQEMVRVTGNFAPTSGTALFNALQLTNTINQTGGANGITRGLFVNPTLTAAADFRAIETARGNVVFGNLPTSSAGLPTGAIWNDGGTLKIV